MGQKATKYESGARMVSTGGGPRQVSVPLESTEKQGARELKMNYLINENTKILGTGAFGKVFLTHNKQNEEFQVAIKVLSMKKLADHIEAIEEEIGILTRLDHPNVVKYYETYADEKYIYLVMEYIGGGELFDKIANQDNQVFGEEMARDYSRKLFSACAHMHSQGVAHRDIKPENIMLTAKGELKLIDFGLSKRQESNKKKFKTIAGTPYYMAPEVLNGNYDYKVDCWSLGVLLYVFTSGYLPFQGDNTSDVFYRISKGKYHFDHKEFQEASPEVIDLIKKLLVVDPEKRLSANEALKHPWFKKDQQITQPPKIDKAMFERLRDFRGVSKLKKAAMNMLIKMNDQVAIEDLQKTFRQIDKEGTGLIAAEDLQHALQNSDLHIPDSEIQKIVAEVDFFGNKKINYTDFLMATMDVKSFLDDQKLQAVFNIFDTQGTGVITKENIVTAMNKIGSSISQRQLDLAMKEHDLEKNGAITFREFKQIFFGLEEMKVAE